MRRSLWLGLALLAACGGGGGGATASVKAAVSATLNAGTVKENASSFTPTASGSSKSSAVGSYSFTDHAGSFTVNTDAFLGNFDVVVSGTTLYLKLPAELVLAARGKLWASADLTNPPAVPGEGNLQSLAGAADPSRLLAGIQEGLVSASKVGNLTIDGAVTTEYSAKVDLTKAKSALASSERTLVGGTTASDDVYVGKDGRLARVVSRVAISGGATETLTVDFSDYGSPVTTKIPAADRVIDGAKLLGQ